MTSTSMADASSSDSRPFRLFSSKSKQKSQPDPPPSPPAADPDSSSIQVDHGDPAADAQPTTSFADLGLAEWTIETCLELGIRRPTPVQRRCIPRILAGENVLGVAHTGSGKTAAFALPILHRFSENPFGVFALVITPTRELACQLAEQFRAFGSALNVRCTLIVGGMDMLGQAKALTRRPHIVVATPGRIKALLEDPDIPAVFSMTKFLVLDEADRVLDVGFEEELRVIFQCLPKTRQTLLFSATMTENLQALLEISGKKSYFFEEYEGFKTVESLKQQYILMPKMLKDVYLFHILSNMEDQGIRSAIVFFGTARSCHMFHLLLKELDVSAVALHSYNSQSARLAALSRFKSGQTPVLLATDLANRGLDIPTVDLVINYDIPRDPRDYVHRVGRTARAGRGGLSISFVTQNDINLYYEIEDVIGKQLNAYECEEKAVLEHITMVFKARRIANSNIIDNGFEGKVQARKAQNKRKRQG